MTSIQTSKHTVRPTLRRVTNVSCRTHQHTIYHHHHHPVLRFISTKWPHWNGFLKNHLVQFNLGTISVIISNGLRWTELEWVLGNHSSIVLVFFFYRHMFSDFMFYCIPILGNVDIILSYWPFNIISSLTIYMYLAFNLDMLEKSITNGIHVRGNCSRMSCIKRSP